MEKHNLTSQEKKQFEMRGHFIKQYGYFHEYVKSILSLTYCIAPLFWILLLCESSQSSCIFFFYTLIILWLIGVCYTSYVYIYSSKIFFGESGIMAFGKITSSKRISNLMNGLTFFQSIYRFFARLTRAIGGLLDILTFQDNFWSSLIRYTLGFGAFSGIYIAGAFIFPEYPFLSYLIIIVIVTISKILNTILGYINPFSIFGNLGEKIQSLTPQIESQSKEIQKHFTRNMDFRILSEGFDSLSKTFSQIIGLVIKLEQVEKKANKGNLFDSEKYIGSLRADIVEPLTSLRSFLEKQKEQLEQSKKELQQVFVQDSPIRDVLATGIKPEGQRVRVRAGEAMDSGINPEGQSNGGREQVELSSKRSESLLVELTENIVKLDAMIRKI